MKNSNTREDKSSASENRDEIVSMYRQFLALTENSLECLKDEDYSRLVELTNKRFKVFQAVSQNSTEPPAEVADYIRKIIDCESKIIELARKKKITIENEFSALNNKGKIARAYCY